MISTIKKRKRRLAMEFCVDGKPNVMVPAKSVHAEDARVEKDACRTPNARLIAAMEEEESDRGINKFKIYNSIEEMMEELLR